MGKAAPVAQGESSEQVLVVSCQQQLEAGVWVYSTRKGSMGGAPIVSTANVPSLHPLSAAATGSFSVVKTYLTSR